MLRPRRRRPLPSSRCWAASLLLSPRRGDELVAIGGLTVRACDLREWIARDDGRGRW